MSACITIKSGDYTSAGIKPNNEDNFGVHIPAAPLLTTKGVCAAIADGMSGSDAGKEASEACISGFLRDYYSTPESWTVKTSAQKVLGSLNIWLHSQGHREYNSHKGMVSTFSAIVFKSNTGYIFHVGDTRIYRLRNNKLKLLTKDHRLDISDKKSYLTRAMGIDNHIDIDYKPVTLEAGDLFMLSTDGVHEFITGDAIHTTLCLDKSLDQRAQLIVEQALENSSNDNLTCLLLQIETLPSENEDEFYKKLTALPFPPPLAPGMTLDGYKIIRHLFSNKRTELYLAHDRDLDSHVVIKAPSVNYMDDPQYINSFLLEEWAGRRITNNHVLNVLDPPRKRTALYYITEYLQGSTLRQWMDDNPRPPLSTVRNFVRQIAQGLRAFHRQQMIHQDLKPENIIIDKHGTLKIIDFGSTKIPGIEEIHIPIQSHRHQGTEDYTAAEFHLGQRATNRTDIYSLGVITYELLTGRIPYAKALSAKNLYKLNYVPVKQYVPDLPYWVDKAIQKAVSIKPEQRFETLSEYVYALNKPDSKLISHEYVPLIKSNPVKVWQSLFVILLITNLLTLYWLFKA
ncbi:MAG: protein kinase [Gammaproteobacteria bacterium]|nr:protein kinase [Gammaproteobacteria bacterium]